MNKAMRLRISDRSVEELTDRLAKMKSQIRVWKDQFDVKSTNKLRGTLIDKSFHIEEKNNRREIAREWAHLQRRIKIVGFAIREWEFLSPTQELAKTND